MGRSYEVTRNQYFRERINWYWKSNVILAIALLGFASAAISGCTIFERDRYNAAATATSTNTAGRRDLTPAFTPTPMHPFPLDVRSCRFIPPEQQDLYTEPHKNGRRVIGDKIFEYLVGKPDKGKFQVLYPGQLLPTDFNSHKDQIWFCRRTFEPIQASPTP